MTEMIQNTEKNEFSDLDHRRRIYYEYAETYHQRFRAYIDFEIEEQPHQLIGILSLALLLSISYWCKAYIMQYWNIPNTVMTVRSGVYGLTICLIFYCFFQTRDGLLVRPHPGFWRIIHGLNLCHLIVMSALACMECWWDSVILDVGFSNILGMLIGAITLRLINCLPYNWFPHHEMCQHYSRISGNSQRTADKARPKKKIRWFRPIFLPFLWSKYHWKFFRTPERLFYASIILSITLLTELNVFLIMYAFNIPAANTYHKIRVTYMCFLAVSAVAEAYQYLNHQGKYPETGKRRLGPNSWLYMAVILVETLVVARFVNERKLRVIPPIGVLLPWSYSFFIFFVWCTCHFLIVGADRLDIPKKLWVSCYKLVATRPDLKNEEKIAEIILAQEGDYVLSLQNAQQRSEVLEAESSALKSLIELFSSRKPIMENLTLKSKLSRKDLESIIRGLLRRQHRWGRLYTFASYVVSFPPLLCFLPVIFLIRYYKFT